MDKVSSFFQEHVSMPDLAGVLQAIGYHAVMLQPLLPMNLHLILSAILPIYAGAHASLSRPSSAAKPPKRDKTEASEDESDSKEHKMEGMSPSDAVVLPLFAGATLAGLYFLIKWLEDPEVLNKTINWYFSLFGILALARFMTDIMGTVTSMVFPSMYSIGRGAWTIDRKHQLARSVDESSKVRGSPLPGRFSMIPLPGIVKNLLWKMRAFPSEKLHIRFFIRSIVSANFKSGPQGIISFLLAVVAQLYFNLVSKPWWLTNALGLSMSYNALQLLSPTTSWTGTLILCALFAYDIYFVFFTPMMVTVATKLDIPAKLLFPRPSGPGNDPTKQAMSMLGLGDIVLPGMMIGFALRFDLYLFYLRKQTPKETKEKRTASESADANSPKGNGQAGNSDMEKDTWYPATGGWGERFWTSRKHLITSKKFHGTIFPKYYFHASFGGYIIGMLLTLGVMQIYGHAQPALLYLVPCVLGGFWGSALVRGDLGTLWDYSEEEGEEKLSKEEESKDKVKGLFGTLWNGSKSSALSSKSGKEPTVNDEKKTSADGHVEQSKSEDSAKDESKASHGSDKNAGKKKHGRKGELFTFSIRLPTPKSDASSEKEVSEKRDVK